MLERRRTNRWQHAPTRVVVTDVRHAPGHWREGVRDVHFFVAPSTFGVLHYFVFHTLLDGLAPIAEGLVVLGLLVVVELGVTHWALDHEITDVIKQACEIADLEAFEPTKIRRWHCRIMHILWRWVCCARKKVVQGLGVNHRYWNRDGYEEY